MGGTITILADYPSSLLQGQSIAILGNEICLPNIDPKFELLNKLTGASLGVTPLTIGGNNTVVSDGLSFYIASTGGGTGDGGFTQVGGGVTHTGVGSGPFGTGLVAGTVFAGGRDSGSLYTPAGGVFAVAPSALASAALPILEAGGFMWAVQNNGATDVLWKLTTGGAVVASFPLTFHSGGIASDGASLWLTDFFGGNIVNISFAGAVLGTFPCGLGEPGRIIFDGNVLWVGDLLSGSVFVFDTGGTFQASANVGVGTIQDFTLDGLDVWLAYQDGATVTHAAKLLYTPQPATPRPVQLAIDTSGSPFNQMPNQTRNIPFFGDKRKWVNFP